MPPGCLAVLAILEAALGYFYDLAWEVLFAKKFRFCLAFCQNNVAQRRSNAAATWKQLRTSL